jgi:hypothetical protein
MATGSTAIADIIVPRIFNPIVQQKTEEKTRVIQSGALAKDGALDALLAGAGLTFDLPSFKPLDNEEENYSSDETDDTLKDTPWNALTNSRPKKIGTATEIGVRLSRNQSWASADLTASLGQKDPMDAVADLVSTYWALRLQAAFIAAAKGVLADNDAAPAAAEHTQYDMTFDASGGSYVAGVTSFSAEAFLDAAITMGDSSDSLGLILMHSIVYNRALKNNLIDFIPDATNTAAQGIPTFLGRRVVVDDAMPASAGVFETWIFGANAFRLGVGSAKVPTETARNPAAGGGGGQEVLYNRVEWMLHPTGYKYDGSAPKSGPTNAATSNNLAHAGSWKRVYTERKMIKFARLKTREYAA